MLALSLLGDFNQDECLEFIGDQGMTEIPDSMTKVLSLAKGAV
jgi:hypothetical protein